MTKLGQCVEVREHYHTQLGLYVILTVRRHPVCFVSHSYHEIFFFFFFFRMLVILFRYNDDELYLLNTVMQYSIVGVIGWMFSIFFPILLIYYQIKMEILRKGNFILIFTQDIRNIMSSHKVIFFGFFLECSYVQYKNLRSLLTIISRVSTVFHLGEANIFWRVFPPAQAGQSTHNIICHQLLEQRTGTVPYVRIDAKKMVPYPLPDNLIFVQCKEVLYVFEAFFSL